MLQKTALDILKTGASVFLTGEPGSGKSFTIKQYIDYLEKKGVYAAITASTGIAATHIGGTTLHAWSGIGIKKSLSSYDIESLHEKKYISQKIRKAKVLIIDEISMLPDYVFDMVNKVCKSIRGVEDKPFGGLQVICVGDFFQLPPIEKSENDKYNNQTDFVFNSNSWKELNPLICYLTEQYRQADEEFSKILSQIRENKKDTYIHEILRKRIIKELTSLPDTTKLYSHNIHVNTVNEKELNKIENKSVVFKMKEFGKEYMCQSLKKGCLSPENLELKVGAKVMFTKNNIEKGFVNGTVGTVVSFLYGKPKVKTSQGLIIEVEEMDWAITEENKVMASITQIPLRLAWAITIHKSQGMSLDSAIMDLSNVFEYGQGYVALSRVKTLNGLHIVGYNEKSLEIHPEVEEIDKIFKDKSKEIERQFLYMKKDEIEKMHENYIEYISPSLQKVFKAKKYRK